MKLQYFKCGRCRKAGHNKRTCKKKPSRKEIYRDLRKRVILAYLKKGMTYSGRISEEELKENGLGGYDEGLD